MTSRERVRTALMRKEPDRVPYCEIYVDPPLAQRLLGQGAPVSHAVNLDKPAYTIQTAKDLARTLRLDNIAYNLRAPTFARMEQGQDGRLFYGRGLIKSEADLALLQFPDPHDDALYAEAERFAREKDDFSAWFVTRVGISSTMQSMGTEDFCLALYDNRPLVQTILDRYGEWIDVVAERVCQMGFDVFVSTDDVAFNTAPFFSPAVFHDLVLPRYESLRKVVSLPWIIHSDGNVLPLLDDFLSVGIAGLHPIEKGALDIRTMKQKYGHLICLLGNVDLNLLGMGEPEEVDREVCELIRDVAPGGGYIVTSGNSLAGYLKPANVLALSHAVQKYGRYPISA